LLTAITNVAGSKIGEQNLLDGTALEVEAGAGVKIDVLGQDVASIRGTTALSDTLVSAMSDKAAVDAALAAALASLENFITESATSYKQLTNRAAVLNDMVEGFNEATAGQSVQDTIGAAGLLSAMLGGNTTA
jgi:UDP-N-acetylglucosamine enolpyruvyl transferase